MSLPPGTQIGKYVVRQKLAEGGMAEIFLCNVQGPRGFEKEVVIKRIRAFLANDPAFVQMFIAEARVASRLNHANVVQIFDFDRHDDTYYLAMEYVRGHSLAEVRTRVRELGASFPPVMAAQLCLEVARGLGYAHRLTDRGRPLGLVHRDVTPHNVLVSYEGAVKLTDFGIAKSAGSRLTAAGMLKGKFAYMSPEQSRGEDVDARTDLFALGLVLWELLAGRRLFEGENDMAVLRAVQEAPVPAPSQVRPGVPQALDAIALKALERGRAHRWQTAQDFERALALFILGHAKGVDDTDVATFVQKLYSQGEVVGAGPAVTVQDSSAPSSPTPASPPRFVVGTPSPDEDMLGPTWVLDRQRSTAAPPGPPPKPDASPARPAGTPPRTETLGAPSGLRRSTALAVLAVALAGAGVGAAALWGLSRPGPTAAQARDRTTATSPVAAGEGTGSPALQPDGGAAGGSAGLATPGLESPSAREAQAALAASAAATAGPAWPAALPSAPVATEAPAAPPVPLPSAGAALAEAAAPSPRPAGPKSSGTKRRSGVLVASAVPWAELFIDGTFRARVDEAPARISLPAGKHVLVFKGPKAEKLFHVSIEAGRETVQTFQPSP